MGVTSANAVKQVEPATKFDFRARVLHNQRSLLFTHLRPLVFLALKAAWLSAKYIKYARGLARDTRVRYRGYEQLSIVPGYQTVLRWECLFTDKFSVVPYNLSGFKQIYILRLLIITPRSVSHQS